MAVVDQVVRSSRPGHEANEAVGGVVVRFADDDDDGEDEDEEKEKDGADDAEDEADFGIFEEVLGGDDRRGDAFSL